MPADGTIDYYASTQDDPWDAPLQVWSHPVGRVVRSREVHQRQNSFKAKVHSKWEPLVQTESVLCTPHGYSPRENVWCCGASLPLPFSGVKMSAEVCLNPSLLCNPTRHVFMGNSLANTQKFSLFYPRPLNFHLCNGTSFNSFFSKKSRLVWRS